MAGTGLFAIYNPPSIRMIILTAFLISVLLLAELINNDLLFVADFIVIVIVAILWFKDIRANPIRAKYSPQGMTPKSDFN